VNADQLAERLFARGIPDVRQALTTTRARAAA
jgi:hypothetical protein